MGLFFDLEFLLSDTDLAIAAIDRAGADVFPAVAMVGRVAARTDDDSPSVDRLAANLAHGRAVVFVPGLVIVDDGDSLAHPS